MHKSMIAGERVDSVLFTTDVIRYHGEVLGRIVGSRYYVTAQTRIDELANELTSLNQILSIGVVDENMHVVGIVERNELHTMLSRQFGRDVYGNKTVSRITKPVRCFDVQRNIFSVAEELADLLHSAQSVYFLLTQEGRNFAGVFSTRDMLIYLSDITRKDIFMARGLQERIVLNNMQVQHKKYSALFMTRMAKGVGGDFYFAKKSAPGKWSGAICDVSGKGVSASLVSAMLGGMITVYDFSQGLAELVRKINVYLSETFEQEKYVTSLFWEIDEERLELCVYDMGHSFCFMFRDGCFYRVKSRAENLPLGLSVSMEPVCDRYKVRSGDTLLFLTDGVLEQINEKGEQFGKARLANSLQGCSADNLPLKGKELFEQLFRFRGAQPQHDDMSLVLLHIN